MTFSDCEKVRNISNQFEINSDGRAERDAHKSRVSRVTEIELQAAGSRQRWPTVGTGDDDDSVWCSHQITSEQETQSCMAAYVALPLMIEIEACRAFFLVFREDRDRTTFSIGRETCQ